MTLRELLATPIVWVLAAFSTVVGALGLGPFIDFIAATSSTWTTIGFVSLRWVLPDLGIVTEAMANQAAIVLALAFVTIKIGEWAEQWVAFLREEDQ